MGFSKAKPEQSKVKIGIYGPSGSGKTFTSLLCAEGLAKITETRVAYVDTERGTDFYAQKVPDRTVHPEAFDFDALYSRSLVDVNRDVQKLNSKEYGVIVIDSITHLWEAAIAAYSGRTTKSGTIPFHAWGKIKKPYKELMAFLLNCPMHVFICGRQGNEYAEDEETEELKMVGHKMKAEGETPYEPHILIRMEQIRRDKSGAREVQAIIEKDRTGVLSGNVFRSPNFDTLIKPLLPYMGTSQAVIDSIEETAAHDAEANAEADATREEESNRLWKQFLAKFQLAADDGQEAVEAVSKELTAPIKKRMLTEHVTDLRNKYREISERWK